MRIPTHETSNTQFLSLLSTDATAIEKSTTQLVYLIVGPLKMAIIVVIMLTKVNYTLLFGILLLLLLIPLQVKLTRLQSKYKYTKRPMQSLHLNKIKQKPLHKTGNW